MDLHACLNRSSCAAFFTSHRVIILSLIPLLVFMHGLSQMLHLMSQLLAALKSCNSKSKVVLLSGAQHLAHRKIVCMTQGHFYLQ